MQGIRTFAAAACAVLVGCGISSTRYVDDADAHSVTRGRITRIAGLNTQSILPLTDGVVLVLTEPGCEVTLSFEDGKSTVYNVGSGDKLVCGTNADYILRPQMTVDLPDGARTDANP